MRTGRSAHWVRLCCSCIAGWLGFTEPSFAQATAPSAGTPPLPGASANYHELIAIPPPSLSPPRAASSAPRPADVWAPRETDESSGLLGPFRIGPVVGLGLPSLFSLGGTIKLGRYFGGGLNFGLIPSTQLSFYGDAELSYQEVDVYGRVYPLGGSLFLGAGVGYATITGHLENPSYRVNGADTVTLPLSSTGSVKTMVLTPQVGFFSTFGSGFSFGLDVGAQIPIAPSKTQFEAHTPSLPQALVDQYIKPHEKEVHSTLEKIGRTPLPTVNLRLGWLL